jgi:hypothetical protein
LGYETTISKKLEMALRVEPNLFLIERLFAFGPSFFRSSSYPKTTNGWFPNVFELQNYHLQICNLSHLFSILQLERLDNKQHISFVLIGLGLDLSLNLLLVVLERSSKEHNAMVVYCLFF